MNDIKMTNVVECNSATFDAKFPNKNKVIEVFSALVQGKDTTKYGKGVDQTVSYVKELGERIGNGDVSAVSELNALRTYTVKPILTQDIKLLGVFGNFQPLGANESIEVEAYDFIGDKSRKQAFNADVVFPKVKKGKYTVGTNTISGGWVTDYRKLALGDMSVENEGMEEVRKDIMNKAKAQVFNTVVDAVNNASIKNIYTSGGTGLTKAGVDSVLAKQRRFGRDLTVIGDYSLLAQFTPWAGYNAEYVYGGSRYGYTQGIAAADLEDLRRNGVLGMYNGAALVENDNPYNFGDIDSTTNWFNTLIDEKVAIVTSRGVEAPIQMWTRGGITSFSGNDVSTGNILTRFDLEFAADVTKGKEFMIGVIADKVL